MRTRALLGLLLMLGASTARAQSAQIAGSVRDDTGGPLPGASVEVRSTSGAPQEVVTDSNGRFLFERLPAGPYELTCRLINFATTRREVVVATSGTSRVDLVLHFALNADVTVTANTTLSRSFSL
jgi:hypothetical protein